MRILFASLMFWLYIILRLKWRFLMCFLAGRGKKLLPFLMLNSFYDIVVKKEQAKKNNKFNLSTICLQWF
ncbi:hypothetical protein C7E23_05050 [Elizabethkingia anophelis]|nr:hypothetical protein C7E23_05050 [Elizabethkingia anophelis]